jgi:ABC-type transport system, involved in lipoprotein release, permease component
MSITRQKKDHEHDTDGGHEHEHDADCDHSHEEREHEEGEHPKEITTLLIRYQNPMGAISLPRLINKSTNMQAASPVQEINRLYSLLGLGIEALTYISGFIILISVLSVFISLLNSLKERKYELALIRVMGGSRFRLFVIVILEGISFAIIGYIVGFVASRFVMFALSTYTDNNFNYTLQQWVTPTDLSLLIASLIIGIVAAIILAIKAMKTNISKTLSQ